MNCELSPSSRSLMILMIDNQMEPGVSRDPGRQAVWFTIQDLTPSMQDLLYLQFCTVITRDISMKQEEKRGQRKKGSGLET